MFSCFTMFPHKFTCTNIHTSVSQLICDTTCLSCADKETWLLASTSLRSSSPQCVDQLTSFLSLLALLSSFGCHTPIILFVQYASSPLVPICPLLANSTIITVVHSLFGRFSVYLNSYFGHARAHDNTKILHAFSFFFLVYSFEMFHTSSYCRQ